MDKYWSFRKIVAIEELVKDELKTYFLKFLSYYYDGIEELDEEEIEDFE